MSLLKRVVVTYWKMPGGGLAAPSVMVCHYVGQEVFEEYMDKERWKKYKETTPWGQLPVYSFEYEEGTLKDGDSVKFTSSIPTLKVLGRTFGLYFTELKQNQKYQADVWMDVSTDCLRTVYPTFKLKDDEKLEARKKLMSEEGKLYKWFHKFNKKLETLMGKEKNFTFLVENTISIADFHFFCTLNSLTCDWLDGIDKSFLEKFDYLHSWYNQFLDHYKERLASKPQKDIYPYVVHKGRYYVYGKDQTEFWTNKDNYIPEEEVKKMDFKGIGCDIETKNLKISKEKLDDLNLNVKQDVKKELEILDSESTLKEVEESSVKLLKNTLNANNVSSNGITEKHELIMKVKEVLISKNKNFETSE